MLDLVEKGTWPEILELAKVPEDAGVTIINTELDGTKREYRPLLPWYLERASPG